MIWPFKRRETRSTTPADTYWSNFAALRSGAAVTPESAQSVAACYAAVGAISEAIGSLPLHLYRRDGDERTRATDHPLYAVLHHTPNPEQSGVEFVEWMTASMLLRGNSYARIVRGHDGQVRQLIPLVTERITAMRKGEAIGGYEYTDRDGKIERLLPEEVFALRHRAGSDPLIGVSPIAASRSAFELALAEAEHGVSTFRNGAKLSGVLQASHLLTAEQAGKLRETWNAKHAGTDAAGNVAVLGQGLEFKPISMSLEDSEWVAARRFSVEEVARIFKIPPVLIGDLSHANYSNSVEMARWFIVHTLRRHLKAWEGAIGRQLLTDVGRRTLYAEFNVEGMLRGDSKTRAEFYQHAIRDQWMTVDEIRKLENLPALKAPSV